jgi:hypothetical protein
MLRFSGEGTPGLAIRLRLPDEPDEAGNGVEPFVPRHPEKMNARVVIWESFEMLRL